MKNSHFQLLSQQIIDRKQGAEDKIEIKRQMKMNIDKNIEEQNQFHSEMKEKENELKTFYRNCLAKQIVEKKTNKK